MSEQSVSVVEPPSSATRRRLVGIEDCAAYLDLSTHTVYTMVSQRRIPFVKVGRLVKFDLALVDAWIHKRMVMPTLQRRP